MSRIGSFSIVDGIGGGVWNRRIAKARLGDAIDLHTKPIAAVWVSPCHRVTSPFGLSCFAQCFLADPDDHELRRLDGSDAHFDNQLPRVDHFWRIVLSVHLYEERLVGGGSEERAVAPNSG